MTTPDIVPIPELDDYGISTEAMALIFGVDEAALRALITPEQRGTGALLRPTEHPIPEAWWRSARRRYREAAAACGSDFIGDVITHLRKEAARP